MARPVRRVLITPRFEKSFSLLPRRVQELTRTKDQWFRNDAFDPRLGTHKLAGRMAGLWSYEVNRNYRVVFRFLTDDAVAYLSIGTHAVYR